jgi:hypothetical protein
MVIFLPRPFYSWQKALGTNFIGDCVVFGNSVRYGLENNLFLLVNIEARLLDHPARSLFSKLITLFQLACLFF